MIVEAIVTALSGGLLSALGWVYTISNRTTAVEVENKGSKELIEEKFENLHKLLSIHLNNINGRLDRIERGMNGHLPKD